MTDTDDTDDTERLKARLFETERHERVWRRLHAQHAHGGFMELVKLVLPERWADGELPDWGPLLAHVRLTLQRTALIRDIGHEIAEARELGQGERLDVAICDLRAVLAANLEQEPRDAARRAEERAKAREVP